MLGSLYNTFGASEEGIDKYVHLNLLISLLKASRPIVKTYIRYENTQEDIESCRTNATAENASMESAREAVDSVIAAIDQIGSEKTKKTAFNELYGSIEVHQCEYGVSKNKDVSFWSNGLADDLMVLVWNLAVIVFVSACTTLDAPKFKEAIELFNWHSRLAGKRDVVNRYQCAVFSLRVFGNAMEHISRAFFAYSLCIKTHKTSKTSPDIEKYAYWFMTSSKTAETLMYFPDWRILFLRISEHAFRWHRLFFLIDRYIITPTDQEAGRNHFLLVARKTVTDSHEAKDYDYQLLSDSLLAFEKNNNIQRSIVPAIIPWSMLSLSGWSTTPSLPPEIVCKKTYDPLATTPTKYFF